MSNLQHIAGRSYTEGRLCSKTVSCKPISGDLCKEGRIEWRDLVSVCDPAADYILFGFAKHRRAKLVLVYFRCGTAWIHCICLAAVVSQTESGYFCSLRLCGDLTVFAADCTYDRRRLVSFLCTAGYCLRRYDRYGSHNPPSVYPKRQIVYFWRRLYRNRSTSVDDGTAFGIYLWDFLCWLVNLSVDRIIHAGNLADIPCYQQQCP